MHVPVRAYLTIGLATGIFTPIHTVLLKKKELYHDLFCHNIRKIGEVLSLAMVHRVGRWPPILHTAGSISCRVDFMYIRRAACLYRNSANFKMSVSSILASHSENKYEG